MPKLTRLIFSYLANLLIYFKGIIKEVTDLETDSKSVTQITLQLLKKMVFLTRKTPDQKNTKLLIQIRNQAFRFVE